MPWKIVQGHPGCPKSKPYAVVGGTSGNRVAGCHPSRVKAIAQQRALYASEASVQEDTLSDDMETIAEVDENVTNGAVLVEDENSEELASDELNIPDDPNPIAWSGPIALEGVPTGDSGMKRYLMPGSLGWRDLPMTLMAQFANEEGHDGAQVAGRIDTLRRDDSAEVQAEFGQGVTVVWGEGVFDTGEAGQEAARMVGNQVLRGISIDLTDSVWKLRDPETNDLYAIHDLPPELADKFFANELQIALESGKIGAATIVPIAALEDASVAIAAAAEKGAIIFSPQPKNTEVDEQIERALKAFNLLTMKERFEGYKLGLELGILTMEDIMAAEGRDLAPFPEAADESEAEEEVDPEQEKKRLLLAALEVATERISSGLKFSAPPFLAQTRGDEDGS